MDRVVPVEYEQLAVAIGMPVDTQACERAREANLEALVAEMQAMERNMTDEQRAERDFERQAAFGPDAELFNMVTGQRFRTG